MGDYGYEDDDWDDTEDECDGAPDPEDDDGSAEDRLHDDIAAGYTSPDGSQPEPDEPDWGMRDD